MAVLAPDSALRAAAAFVFVGDLESPDLRDDDAHHLGEVLRLKPGQAVAAADGAGAWRMCVFCGPVASTGRRAGNSRHFALEASGPVVREPRPSPELEVAFSWAKGERTEWAVAKLVEIGLNRLTPLVADRTVVRPDGNGAARREARLHKIAREAAMLSRRPHLPEIVTSQSVDQVVARCGPSSVALAEPGGEPLSLSTPVVLVGPEGGWTPRELSTVEQKVGLGDGVLRVETAALAAGVLLAALRNGSAPRQR